MDAEKLKLERKDSDVITALDLESEDAVDPALDKALRWKIDLRLIPLLCITYALQSIDKTTLSYAAVFGIRESLDLVGTQFSWASSVFYLGYLIWEYPTNLLLQKLPVNTFLSVTVGSIPFDIAASADNVHRLSFGVVYSCVMLQSTALAALWQCAHSSGCLKRQ